ncbi:hypothetical protein V3C99_010021 [Haemonchus contortus]|uniref:Uncharacterized protein n=1 Tax=Haemonchus contortus TaxID=6289 RepID=A0A7I4YI36_HAECO|nr:unnamed protein product [Haemonchus contortus]
MYLIYTLPILAISIAAENKKQGTPVMDKEATDKLPPMDPQKGTFCVCGGYYPYYNYYYPAGYYPYYNYFYPCYGCAYYSPIAALLGRLL